MMITACCVADEQLEERWWHAVSRDDLLAQIRTWVHEIPAEQGASAEWRDRLEVLEAYEAFTDWEPSDQVKYVFNDGAWWWVLLITSSEV